MQPLLKGYNFAAKKGRSSAVPTEADRLITWRKRLGKINLQELAQGCGVPFRARRKRNT